MNISRALALIAAIGIGSVVTLAIQPSPRIVLRDGAVVRNVDLYNQGSPVFEADGVKGVEISGNRIFGGGILIGSASAQPVGNVPNNGFNTTDGTWLNGLANGQNLTFVSGLTATAGGTQAAGLALPPSATLIQVDTVATSGDSVVLPQCLASRVLTIINAGAGTLYVYGKVAVNPITGVADTINGTSGSTAYQMATLIVSQFICAKNGAWKALKSA